jgi:hypothetical protein
MGVSFSTATPDNNSPPATYNSTFYSQGVLFRRIRNGAINDSKSMAGCCAHIELPAAFLYLGFDGACARVQSGLA